MARSLRQPAPLIKSTVFKEVKALSGLYLTTCCKKLKVSGVSVQDLAPQLPDTRNLTPDTYNQRICCPPGAIFPKRSLGKSVVR